VQNVTIIGSGTMGHAIGQLAAGSGLDVRFFDADAGALARAMDRVHANLRRAVERGMLAASDVTPILGRIQPSPELDAALADADVVIEAIPENLDLKLQLFTRMGAIVRPDTLLASNTSALSITRIASATTFPERVLGMHFFNPPSAVLLLELVRGKQTSEDTLSRARALGERMGRRVIVVKDSPGFASSRLGVVLALEAMRMLESGVASAEDIDTALEVGYRHAMGPLRTTDFVGLDVRLAIAEHLHRELGGEQYRPPRILRDMVAAGKLGQKTGQGFFSWT
jgi:3-hydroxybutyryl-CoA dehydrogenase